MMHNTSTTGRSRVIITGSRDYFDAKFIYKKLDKLLAKLKRPILVFGDARGVDAIAERYACDRLRQYQKYRAAWNENGKAAGPIRNSEMLKFALERMPSYCVAFWKDGSPGTKDMITKARKAGLKLRIFEV